MCQPIRCGIQLRALGLEITDNSIFLEHISSVVQAWRANMSLWKCQTCTYSIISGCKSHTADSCCKPQEHTGLTQQAFGMCIGSPRCSGSTWLIACALYSHVQTFLPGQWQEKILHFNFCFPLFPDANKTKPLMDFHLALKTDD